MTAIMTKSFEADPRLTNPITADLTGAAGGILAGTKVATQHGWRAVQTVAPGDLVLTFDRGMQRVMRVQTHVLELRAHVDVEDAPLFVPQGALGNLAACVLMPGQPVLVESDLAEDMLGDAFVAVPAGALVGVEGMTPVLPEGPLTVVTLHFARDEVVFGAGGVMFVCEGRGNLLLDEAPGYPVLSPDLARMVVAGGVMPAGAAGPLEQCAAA